MRPTRSFSYASSPPTPSLLDRPLRRPPRGQPEQPASLAGALQIGGLTDTLGRDDAAFTVFAPSNAAFDGIDALRTPVLTDHVVPGQAIASGNLQDGQAAEAIEGPPGA